MPDHIPNCPSCGLPHTTRHGHQACTGHAKRTAEGRGDPGPCKLPPIRGGTVCIVHGGQTRRAKTAAADRLVKAAATKQLAKLGQPLAIDPDAALLDLVHWTAGEVAYWRAQVVALEAEHGPRGLTWGVTKVKEGGDDGGTTMEAKPAAEYALMRDASDRLAQYAKAAISAGIAERHVRLAESQGAIVAEAFTRVFALLGLTAEQLAAAPKIVARVLRELADTQPAALPGQVIR